MSVVAEGSWRAVGTVAIGEGVDAVLVAGEQEAEAPVDDVAEGDVIHADAVMRGDGFDCLRHEDARVVEGIFFSLPTYSGGGLGWGLFSDGIEALLILERCPHPSPLPEYLRRE